ncbi:MAG: hypothetical protein PHG68_03650, partial [Candidatus Omnitrophica bacterium]|nr:hypothetical protein [Candidatus Omnitrophota bacterium]
GREFIKFDLKENELEIEINQNRSEIYRFDPATGAVGERIAVAEKALEKKVNGLELMMVKRVNTEGKVEREQRILQTTHGKVLGYTYEVNYPEGKKLVFTASVSSPKSGQVTFGYFLNDQLKPGGTARARTTYLRVQPGLYYVQIEHLRAPVGNEKIGQVFHTQLEIQSAKGTEGYVYMVDFGGREGKKPLVFLKKHPVDGMVSEGKILNEATLQGEGAVRGRSTFRAQPDGNFLVTVEHLSEEIDPATNAPKVIRTVMEIHNALGEVVKRITKVDDRYVADSVAPDAQGFQVRRVFDFTAMRETDEILGYSKTETFPIEGLVVIGLYDKDAARTFLNRYELQTADGQLRARISFNKDTNKWYYDTAEADASGYFKRFEFNMNTKQKIGNPIGYSKQAFVLGAFKVIELYGPNQEKQNRFEVIDNFGQVVARLGRDNDTAVTGYYDDVKVNSEGYFARYEFNFNTHARENTPNGFAKDAGFKINNLPVLELFTRNARNEYVSRNRFEVQELGIPVAWIRREPGTNKGYYDEARPDAQGYYARYDFDFNNNQKGNSPVGYSQRTDLRFGDNLVIALFDAARKAKNQYEVLSNGERIALLLTKPEKGYNGRVLWEEYVEREIAGRTGKFQAQRLHYYRLDAATRTITVFGKDGKAVEITAAQRGENQIGWAVIEGPVQTLEFQFKDSQGKDQVVKLAFRPVVHMDTENNIMLPGRIGTDPDTGEQNLFRYEDKGRVMVAVNIPVSRIFNADTYRKLGLSGTEMANALLKFENGKITNTLIGWAIIEGKDEVLALRYRNQSGSEQSVRLTYTPVIHVDVSGNSILPGRIGIDPQTGEQNIYRYEDKGRIVYVTKIPVGTIFNEATFKKFGLSGSEPANAILKFDRVAPTDNLLGWAVSEGSAKAITFTYKNASGIEQQASITYSPIIHLDTMGNSMLPGRIGIDPVTGEQNVFRYEGTDRIVLVTNFSAKDIFAREALTKYGLNGGDGVNVIFDEKENKIAGWAVTIAKKLPVSIEDEEGRKYDYKYNLIKNIYLAPTEEPTYLGIDDNTGAELIKFKAKEASVLLRDKQGRQIGYDTYRVDLAKIKEGILKAGEVTSQSRTKTGYGTYHIKPNEELKILMGEYYGYALPHMSPHEIKGINVAAGDRIIFWAKSEGNKANLKVHLIYGTLLGKEEDPAYTVEKTWTRVEVPLRQGKLARISFIDNNNRIDIGPVFILKNGEKPIPLDRIAGKIYYKNYIDPELSPYFFSDQVFNPDEIKDSKVVTEEDRKIFYPNGESVLPFFVRSGYTHSIEKGNRVEEDKKEHHIGMTHYIEQDAKGNMVYKTWTQKYSHTVAYNQKVIPVYYVYDSGELKDAYITTWRE